jgi:hypothetical protein
VLRVTDARTLRLAGLGASGSAVGLVRMVVEEGGSGIEGYD